MAIGLEREVWGQLDEQSVAGARGESDTGSAVPGLLLGATHVECWRHTHRAAAPRRSAVAAAWLRAEDRTCRDQPSGRAARARPRAAAGGGPVPPDQSPRASLRA